MVFAKCQGDRFIIDGELGENHAILVDQVQCDFGCSKFNDDFSIKLIFSFSAGTDKDDPRTERI